MNKKLLINCSNHPSLKWSAEQKEGWDIIIDVPFPAIDPRWEVNSEEYVLALVNARNAILDALSLPEYKEYEKYIMLQGEFSFCYLMYHKLSLLDSYSFKSFVIPTTERVIEEQVENGICKKVATFKFVMWREIKKWVLNPETTHMSV